MIVEKDRAMEIAVKWRKFCAPDVGDPELAVLVGYITNALEDGAASWAKELSTAREARDQAERHGIEIEKKRIGLSPLPPNPFR